MQNIFSRFTSLFVILGIVVVLGLWSVSSYNSLVALSESTDTQWSQVETQYQRRLDLVPNLVATAQAVMTQEKDVFTAIANARQGYAGAKTVGDKVQAANQLEGALSRLLVITENYPQLKTSEVMQGLQAQLEGTENRISVERMRYNDMVNTYNVKVKSFPGNLFANMFGFEVKKKFEAEQGAEKAPKVEFK